MPENLRQLPDLTADECAEIVTLRRDGCSPRDLARRFGTSDQTIRKIYQREIFA